MTFEERKIKEWKDRKLGCCGGDGCPYYEMYDFEKVKDHDDAVEQFLSTALSEYKEELLGKMPKEMNELKNDIRNVALYKRGFDTCLDQVNKIIKES